MTDSGLGNQAVPACGAVPDTGMQALLEDRGPRTPATSK